MKIDDTLIAKMIRVKGYVARKKGLDQNNKAPFVIIGIGTAVQDTGTVMPVAFARRNMAETAEFTRMELLSKGVEVFHPKRERQFHLVQTHRDKNGNTGWIICDGHDEWAFDGQVYRTRLEAFESMQKLEDAYGTK